MPVRNNFAAGEVLAAADLNDTFASKWNAKVSDTAPSAPVEGDAWVDTTGSTTVPKIYTGTAWQAFGGGKILQVIRSTNSTDRTTTSTSFVDVTGSSVSITPQKSDSGIIVITTGAMYTEFSSGANGIGRIIITDSSNNAISGAQSTGFGLVNVTSGGSINFLSGFTIIGYSTPATTSQVTYKMRFRCSSSGTTGINNTDSTGQMYAIEVSA